jgi:hypothetical protein
MLEKPVERLAHRHLRLSSCDSLTTGRCPTRGPPARPSPRRVTNAGNAWTIAGRSANRLAAEWSSTLDCPGSFWTSPKNPSGASSGIDPPSGHPPFLRLHGDVRGARLLARRSRVQRVCLPSRRIARPQFRGLAGRDASLSRSLSKSSVPYSVCLHIECLHTPSLMYRVCLPTPHCGGLGFLATNTPSIECSSIPPQDYVISGGLPPYVQGVCTSLPSH